MLWTAKATAIVLASMLLAGCDPSGDETDYDALVEERVNDEEKKIQALRSIVPLIDKDPRFTKHFEQCPASSFGSERDSLTAIVRNTLGSEDLDMFTCSLLPETCFDLCKEGEPDACLGLAQALEDFETELGEVPGRKAYAFACAAGSAAGCTNRGGGMQNYPIEGDAMSNLPVEEKAQCHFELFKVGCENDDGWGCTMLGDAYANARGVAVDQQKAREALAKACLPEMNEQSCEYAKTILEGIE